MTRRIRYCWPLLLFAFASGASARDFWDAGKDLVANEMPDGASHEIQNPNPTVPEWSYGYRATLASVGLTLFTTGHSNGANGLDGYQAAAVVVANTGASDVIINNGFGPLLPVPPGEIVQHPSAANEYSVIRWTSPATASYEVEAYWQDIDSYGGGGVTVHLVVNGSPIFNETAFNTAKSTKRTLPLKAGDLVDFAVGSNGAYDFDTTRFKATLTKINTAPTGMTEATRMIPGTANIYGAGHSAPPAAGFGGSGTLPPSIAFRASTGKVLQVVAASGSVTLDKVTNNAGSGPFGPDGGSFYAPTDVLSTGGLSGVKSSVAGFLAGVFLDTTEPTNPSPDILDFTTAGMGTNFKTLSPAVGQVFFIGDGRTKLGAPQQFTVPPTATRLFLGIVDAADGDNAAGPPQAYNDNGGEFTASVRIDQEVNRIVYNSASLFSTYGDIYIMNADGTGKTNLTSGAYYVESPELSADGKYVVFRGSQTAPGPGGVTLMGVWVMKAQPVGPENKPVLVSPNLNYGYNFSWHPDSQYLAVGEFVTSHPLVTVLRVVNDEGVITPVSAGNPAVRMTLAADSDFQAGANFSPDGQYLAMTTRDRRIDLLRAFDSSGNLTPESATNPRIPVSNESPLIQLGKPEWSPDATRLVFRQTKVEANYANPFSMLAILPVRDASGKPTPESAENPRVRQTAPVAGNYLTESPSWSADGKRIAFSWAPNDTTSINVFSVLASSPENDATNPKVQLTNPTSGGAMNPSFAQAYKFVPKPAKVFTMALVGLQDRQLVAPKTEISLTPKFTPLSNPGATISKVQFFINGNAVGSPKTIAPFAYESTVSSAGERIVTAEATDSLGRKIICAPLRFTVTPAGAGQLALETVILPKGEKYAPGELIIYKLRATNTSDTNTAKSVRLVAPVPDDTKYYRADAFSETGNKLSPRPVVSDNKREVVFSLGDIPPGKTRVAELTVRIPYDQRPGRNPIKNYDFVITGVGIGNKAFTGEFQPIAREIAGPAPKNAPRLHMIKTLVDLADDDTDQLVMFDDPEHGSIASAAYGDVLTFLLVIRNSGGLPAEKISIKDRIPPGFQLVPKSVRVNDVSAGALLEVDGRTLNFQLGDVQADELVIVQYQLSVLSRENGGPLTDIVTYSVGADVGAMNLRSRPNSAPERLPIKIVKAGGIATDSPRRYPAKAEVGQLLAYNYEYHNNGQRNARDEITVKIPEGAELATKEDLNKSTNPYFKKLGAPLFFGTPKTGQSVTLNSVPRSVVFNLGSVPPKANGETSSGNFTVIFKVKSSILNKTLPKLVVETYSKSSLLAAPLDSGSSAREALVAGTLISEDTCPVVGPNLPQLAIIQSAPQQVQSGGQFTYEITVINLSDVPIGGSTALGGVILRIPEGAEYLSSSGGNIDKSKRSFYAHWQQVTKNANAELAPRSAKTVTVLLKATGGAGTVIKSSRCYAYSSQTYEVFLPVVTTLIIDGPATDPTNQTAIVRAQVESMGSAASCALLDDRIADIARKIDGNSRSIRLGGANYIQLIDGRIIIPLGANKTSEDPVLIMGPEALIGMDGASVIGQNGASVIGQNGATLTAIGPSSAFKFNRLIGMDGASLGNQSVAHILNNIRDKDPANLVAAGAGNLVAAGAGNLIGMDGASLIGPDGGTISNLLGFINAGNLRVVLPAVDLAGPNGFGLIKERLDNITILDPESLATTIGGELHLVGNQAIPFADGTFPKSVSGDAVALAATLDGSIIGGSGGAPPLVAAGAGN